MRYLFILSFILITSNVFVSCDNVKKEEVQVSICSFMPETEEPTQRPIPVVPTTPKPKPTTDADSFTDDDDNNTESEKPSTDSTTTTIAETSPADTASVSTAETASTSTAETVSTSTAETVSTSTAETASTSTAETTATTPSDTTTTTTTTKSEATTTTEFDDSTTDEENGNEEDNKKDPAIKNLKSEDEEILINNNSKHRFLLEADEFPPKQNDELIKSIARTAFNSTCNTAGLNFTIDDIKIDVEYIYEEKKSVTYNIRISNIMIENTVDNNNTWEKIVEALEGNNGLFYEIMFNSTDNNYTECNMPDRLKDPTPCDYDKRYYEWLAKENSEDKKVSPIIKEGDPSNITYSINCMNNVDNFIKPNSTSGIFTVEIKQSRKAAYCNVKCSAKDYRDSYNQLTFIVKDNKPSFTKVGTVVPVYQNTEEKFTVIMKIAYPDGITADNAKKMKVTNSGSCKLEGTNDVTAADGSKFKFVDLQYKCQYTGTYTEKLTFTIDDTSKEYTIQVVERPKFIADTTSTKPDGSTEAPPEPEYECERDDLSLDPITNLCCSRNAGLGESCNKLKISFPFAKTSSTTAIKLDDEFIDDYVKMLRKYAFDHSNFNFTVTNNGEGFVIEIEVKFYSQKTFVYSAGELIRRSLQQGMDWNALPTPFLYIQTVVSYIEPNAQSESTGGSGGSDGDGSGSDISKIEKEIPEVLKDALPTDKRNEILTQIYKVKTEASKEVTEISGKYDVTLDVEKGISVVPEVVEGATMPTVTNGKLERNDKPEEKSWASKNWWVILIICLVVIILIAVIVVVLYITLSSKSGGSSLSPRSVSTSKKDIQKSEKIMETVIPIDKIKEENGVEDEDIYKPFTYDVIMEGYLLKEGHDRVIGKWQRRYCVLYYDPAILRIYDSMVPSLYGKVYLEEKQSIPLACYNGIEYKEGSNEFTLVLKIRESNLKTFEPGDVERKIQMKVDGDDAKETARKWVECFRDFKNQKPKPAEAWARPLIMDDSNGKITTTTQRATEKKNEEIINMVHERRKQTREN